MLDRYPNATGNLAVDRGEFGILIADPLRTKLTLPDAVLFASGLDRAAEELLARQQGPSIIEALCRDIGDAVVVRLELAGERVTTLQAWRGITSAFELFYSLRPDGAILVSDHFRNILTQIAFEERQPSSAAVLDHFLFRTVPGRSSYSRAIHRLGHGERLTIDARSGAAEVTAFDRIGVSPAAPRADSPESLDAAFARAVGGLEGRSNLVSMFSGGVDSTLLQTYLDRHMPAVFFAPERVRPGTPDLTRYAVQSAKLLGLQLDIRPLREDDTWDYVEQNIDRGVWPQHSIQSVKYGHAFESGWDGFVLGERADALFGAAATRSALVALRARQPWLRLPLAAIAHLPHARLAARARGVLRSAEELSRPPDSPEGWAGMSTRGFSDYGIVTEIVGSAAVRDALSRRLSYVAGRLDPAFSAQAPFARHLELGHWIDYLCEDHTTFIRQLALAHGKSVFLPFLAGPVVRTAISVPAERRYHRGLQIKYLLKDALRRRLPAYPVDQRKSITSMSMPNRYRGSELRAFWEDYPMPDFVPKRHHAALVNFSNAMSSCAMMFAVLQKRVLRNPEISLLPGTEILRHPRA